MEKSFLLRNLGSRWVTFLKLLSSVLLELPRRHVNRGKIKTQIRSLAVPGTVPVLELLGTFVHQFAKTQNFGRSYFPPSQNE